MDKVFKNFSVIFLNLVIFIQVIYNVNNNRWRDKMKKKRINLPTSETRLGGGYIRK